MMPEVNKFTIRTRRGEKITNAETAIASITRELNDSGLGQQADGVGTALVKLFGRLVELMFNRLNRVPEKSFLAFLNRAGISLLPPLASSTIVKFNPDPAAIDFVKVPAGTQVATVKSEDLPEIIFETRRDVIVTASELVHCISFDSYAFSDNSALARGEQEGSFGAFEGREERRRRLFIGDRELFVFDDETIRQAATISIGLNITKAGDTLADEWEMQWQFWNGEQWIDLEEAGAEVIDESDNFTLSGNRNISISKLPEMLESQVGEITAFWIACELIGGNARNHLPLFNDITITRSVSLTPNWKPGELLFSVVQAGTIFTILSQTGEFFPLGQRPGRLDTFYLRSDEVFNKHGASAKISIDEIGLPDFVGDDSEIDSLIVEWEYHSTEGWILLGESSLSGTSHTQLNFQDATRAFTQTGDNLEIIFTIPDQVADVTQLPFAPVKVNGEEGLWIRARVKQGSYNEPGGTVNGESGQFEWTPPKSHPPFIKTLVLSYSNYALPDVGPKPVQYGLSDVDGSIYDHATSLSVQQDFAPFSATDEGPSMYLGFDRQLPGGQWMQLLLDVESASSFPQSEPLISWEYWNGGWHALQVSDGSQGLSRRGYIGFFAPNDQVEHKAFSRNAFWIRALPHRAPVANAGRDQIDILPNNGLSTVTLSGAASIAHGRHGIKKYIWQIRSSSVAPVANMVFSKPQELPGGREFSVTLDASASRAFGGRSIAKYFVNKVVPGDEAEVTTNMTPYLKRIATNSVPVINAESLYKETLGSSDNKPGQQFQITRTPILPGAQIAVREPDLPPQDEFALLTAELMVDDPQAIALVESPGENEHGGVWIRWHQVEDFHGSKSSSRHFMLDAITGEITFGDGKQGKIPPIGLDNIMALCYQTHSSVMGNIATDRITVMRNPSGELANIKSLSNFEAAAGGSKAESVEQVKLRGPQIIKHRERAVTCEDYEWLAREASSEIAQARCLAGLNRLAIAEPGWVTVVITPQSTALKPYPTPGLLRTVEDHLERHAFASLQAGKQIYVKGPEYIETTIVADVVATEPENADEVELEIILALETFLHPLNGGPESDGWQLGRDVFLSEVYTVIEAVQGVNYVRRLDLLASLQQYRIELQNNHLIPFDVPEGSQVATFDERIKLVLAKRLKKDPLGKDVPDKWQLAAYGFKVGDQVIIVSSDNTIIEQNLTIAALDGDKVLFAEPFVYKEISWELRDALATEDLKIRLSLRQDAEIIEDTNVILGLTLKSIEPGEKLSIGSGGKRDQRMEFLPITKIEAETDRIFVPQGHLVYSGTHQIEMVLE